LSDAPGDFSCRLTCVYSEGIDVKSLAESQRSVSLPFEPSREPLELVVGRSGRMAHMWDTLVPVEHIRGMISRDHFKVVRRGSTEKDWILACLSPNGLSLNSDVISGYPAERSLTDGDIISLLAVVEKSPDGSPPLRRNIVTFAVQFGRERGSLATGGPSLAADRGLNAPVAITGLDNAADNDAIPPPPTSWNLRPSAAYGRETVGAEIGTVPGTAQYVWPRSPDSPQKGMTPSSSAAKALQTLDIEPEPPTPAKMLPDADEDLGVTPLACEVADASPTLQGAAVEESKAARQRRSSGWSGAGAAGVLRIPVDVDLEDD